MPRLQIASRTSTIISVTPVPSCQRQIPHQWKIRLRDSVEISSRVTPRLNQRRRAHAQKPLNYSHREGIRHVELIIRLRRIISRNGIKPAITESSRLSPNSKARYKTVLTYLTEAFRGTRLQSPEALHRRTAQGQRCWARRRKAAGTPRVASRYFFEELIKDVSR